MPMMMHHDSQPLYSRGSNYGLLNQIELLRRAGAVSMQVLMLTPAAGSKLLESTYTSGQVFKSVGGKEVRPHMCDGNYVVASQPQATLAEAADDAGGLSVLLQSGLARRRVDPSQDARWPRNGPTCRSSA